MLAGHGRRRVEDAGTRRQQIARRGAAFLRQQAADVVDSEFVEGRAEPDGSVGDRGSVEDGQNALRVEAR